MLFEAAADASKHFMQQVFNQNMSQNTFPYTAPGPGPHEKMFLSWGGELPLRCATNIQQTPWVACVPILRPHHSHKGGGSRLAFGAAFGPGSVSSSFTGNAKEVQAPQHGSLQDPALGLGKQFLENPDG